MNIKLKTTIYGTLILLLFFGFIALCAYNPIVLGIFFALFFLFSISYLIYGAVYERLSENNKELKNDR